MLKFAPETALPKKLMKDGISSILVVWLVTVMKDLPLKFVCGRLSVTNGVFTVWPVRLRFSGFSTAVMASGVSIEELREKSTLFCVGFSRLAE